MKARDNRQRIAEHSKTSLHERNGEYVIKQGTVASSICRNEWLLVVDARGKKMAITMILMILMTMMKMKKMKMMTKMVIMTGACAKHMTKNIQISSHKGSRSQADHSGAVMLSMPPRSRKIV